jgi:hypothetical protein
MGVSLITVARGLLQIMSSPIPPIANPALAVLGHGVSAVQRQKQLEGLGDQILIDALAILSANAAAAAKAIVDEAEAIFTDAKVCRWENDEDVHALHVRIAHYWEDHPRLTSLEEALDQLPDLLDELGRRAKRRVQMPKTKQKKQKAINDALKASDSLKQFAKDLPNETKHLPVGSGLAAEQLHGLDGIALLPVPTRVEQQASGRVNQLVAEGKDVVKQSRARALSSSAQTAVTRIRTAFT